MPGSRRPITAPGPAREEDLEQAAMIAAEIVRQLGETYWPIFARLERELEARESRAKRLARFLRPNSKR